MNARVCYDWSALGYHEDPIPGDPEQVEATAKSYASTSDTILQVSDYLAKLDGNGQQSLTITALKARSRELSGQLQSVSTRYTETAAALRYYAPELRAAQAIADAAISAGGPAESRRKSAKGNADSIWWGWKTTLEPAQATQFEESYFLAKSQADSAAADVAAAKTKILEAIHRRDTAADAAKSMIHSAIENSPVTDTVLDTFKEVFDKAVDILTKVGQWVWDNIDTIALVLTIAAAVTAFIPGLNVISPFLAGAARIANVISKVKAAVNTAKAVVKAVTTGDVSDLVAVGATYVAGKALGKLTGLVTKPLGKAAGTMYGKALHAANKETSAKVWGKLSTIVTGSSARGMSLSTLDKAMSSATPSVKAELQRTLTSLTQSTVSGETNRELQKLVGHEVGKQAGKVFSPLKDAIKDAVGTGAKEGTNMIIRSVSSSTPNTSAINRGYGGFGGGTPGGGGAGGGW